MSGELIKVLVIVGRLRDSMARSRSRAISDPPYVGNARRAALEDLERMERRELRQDLKAAEVAFRKAVARCLVTGQFRKKP